MASDDGLGDFGYAGPIISGPAGVAGSSGSYRRFQDQWHGSNVTGFTASDIDVTGVPFPILQQFPVAIYFYSDGTKPSDVHCVPDGAARTNGRGTIANLFA